MRQIKFKFRNQIRALKLYYSLFGRIISDGRRSPSQVMVQNRVIKSRRNTREERQQKVLRKKTWAGKGKECCDYTVAGRECR